MTKKVAYVLKMYPRFSQTFVVNELLAHQAAGRTMDIFSLRLPDDARFHEAVSRVASDVHRIKRPGGRSASFLATLQDALQVFPDAAAVIRDNPGVLASDMEQALLLALKARKLGIDHLHAHFGTVATTTSRLAARMAGISYSFTAHAKDIFHESVDPDVLRAKLADAAAVVTVSDYNLRWLREHYGEAADRVVHIDNGLTLDEFPFLDPAERAPFIFGVGRLVEKKGFEYLVDACAALRDRGVAFRCEIAGGGLLSGQLSRRVKERDLSESVRLIGPQPQAVIRRKLHEASVLAAPCVVAADQDRDGLPTILLEAMAMGTPCVSTNVTGIPEIIEDGVTGLAVNQRDATSLADACERLLDDSPLRSRLAQAARAQIEARFDIDDNAARLRRLFDALPDTGRA